MLEDSLEWQDVEHVKGHWVVNLGTLLQRWTNGEFHATLHRVVITEPAHRFSLPFFYEAALDAPIACVPSCVGRGEPAPPTTPGDLLLDMAAREGVAVYREPTAG